MKTKLFFLVVLTFSLSVVHAQEKLLSSITQSYDGSNWINNNASNYNYDTNGNLITETYFIWNSTHWENSSNTSYVYNGNNMVTEEIYQEWNSTNNQFENSYKDTYVYDSNGNIQNFFSYMWDATQWVLEYKRTAYYQNNKLDYVISAKWDGSQYVNEEKGVLTYTNGNVTEILDQNWNVTTSAWTDTSKDVYTYNTTTNKKELVETQNWNGSVWKLEFKTEYTTDNDGNRISSIDYNQDEIPQSKTDYAYDNSFLMSNIYHPFKDKTGIDYYYEDFPYTHKILSSTDSQYIGVAAKNNSATTSYMQSTKTTYDYESAITLAVNNQEALSLIKLFPNPVIESFEIAPITQPEKVSIYNTLGKKLMEQFVYRGKKVEVKNLAGGIYFLKFKSGKTLKFIKK